MSYTFQISYNSGSTYSDYTNNVIQNSVEYSDRLHSDLKPNSNYATLQAIVDSTLKSHLINSETPVLFKLAKDGSQILEGVVSPIFDVTNTTTGAMPVKLKLEDFTIYKLKRRFNANINWTSYYVCNPTNISASIVHQVLSLAGVTAASYPTIPIQIPAIVINTEDKTTYFDFLSDLLFEFGYTFYYGLDGRLCFYNFSECPNNLSAITNELRAEYDSANNNILNGMTTKSTRGSYDAVKLTWYKKSLESNLLLSEQTDYISTPAGSYYPSLGSSTSTFTDYSNPNYDIIGVVSATLTYDAVGMTLYQSLVNYGKRGLFTLYNPNGYACNAKHSIHGNAWVKSDKGITFAQIRSDVINTFEYECKYIRDSSNAQLLSIILKNYYAFNKQGYEVTSFDFFSLGSYVKVVNVTNDNFYGYGRIKQIDYNKSGSYTYHIESITAYSNTDTSTTTYVAKPSQNYVTPEDIQGITENLPTLDTIFEGYSIPALGATDTPTEVQLSAQGTYKAIVVSWTKQNNLTNLKEYQVQVSSDNTTWYSLRFDRVDWKGTQGQYTVWNTETLVHTLPDNLVNGSPTPYTLYYRVRQATRKDDTSNYVSTQATSKIVDSGDIAANSISANQLKVDTINSQIANFSNSIRISPSGFQGQTYGQADCPRYQERRLYLDTDELTIQDYTINTSGFNLMTDDFGNISLTTINGLADNLSSACMYYSRLMIIYDVQVSGTYYTKVSMLKKNPDSYKYEEKYTYTLMTYDNSTYFRLGQPMDIYCLSTTDQIAYRFAYKKYENGVYKYYNRIGSFYLTSNPYSVQNHSTTDIEKKYETSKSVLMRTDYYNLDMCLIYAAPGTTDTTNAQYIGWRIGNYLTFGTATKIADSLLTITGWDDIHKNNSVYGYYFVSANEANICFKIDSSTKLPVIIAQPTGLITGAKVYHLDTYGADYPLVLLKNSAESSTGYLMYDLVILQNSADTLINKTVSTKTSTCPAQKSIQLGRYFFGSVVSYYLLSYQSEPGWGYHYQYFKAFTTTFNFAANPSTMTIDTTVSIKDILLPNDWYTTNNIMVDKDYSLYSTATPKAVETYIFRNSTTGCYQLFEGGFRLYWNDGIKIGRGTNDITCNKINCNEIASSTVIYAKYAP